MYPPNIYGGAGVHVGIKEVVVDGETGFLVPLEQMQKTPFEPVDPDKFSRDMAEKISRLMADEALGTKFGEAGRKRAVEKFSWAAIAAETKKSTNPSSPRLFGGSPFRVFKRLAPS